MPPALKGVLQLPGSVRRKVDAALYWIREPRSLLLEMHRKDVLRVFSAYWNAFECLVDAVGTLAPLPGLSPSEKQAAIDSRLLERHGKLTTQDIQELFNNVVNPGFVGKAIHALKLTCGVDASRYIEECFRLPDAENRLYKIRNATNHGDVDAENLLEVIRIDSRLSTLRLMVLRIFGRFVPFQYPVDTPPAAADGTTSRA